MKFRIEHVFRAREEIYVFAQALTEASFSLPANPRLGNAKIKPWFDQPRRLLPDGRPDLQCFAFVLQDEADQELLIPGSEHELTAG